MALGDRIADRPSLDPLTYAALRPADESTWASGSGSAACAPATSGRCWRAGRPLRAGAEPHAALDCLDGDEQRVGDLAVRAALGREVDHSRDRRHPERPEGGAVMTPGVGSQQLRAEGMLELEHGAYRASEIGLYSSYQLPSPPPLSPLTNIPDDLLPSARIAATSARGKTSDAPGMRLPFGEYTDIEILDTLEVLAHDRYEDLLKKAGIINEAFVDRRTRAVLLVSTVETTDVSTPVVSATDGEPSIAATPEGQPVVAPTSYMDRAVAGFITLLGEEQRKVAAKPAYSEVLEVVELRPLRHGKPEVSDDRGDIKRHVAYAFKRSVYTQDWFDSGTEGIVANIIDEADEVAFWLRLQKGDLPILWTSGGREYNPDFIVVETGDAHWVVEVKQDKEMTSADVAGKREAALRWANWVNASPDVAEHWGYLVSWLRYDDALEHSVWLTLMRDRLVQIRKLLAPNGSIWVHCDDSEGAHLRVLMDELFPNQWVYLSPRPTSRPPRARGPH